MKRWWCPLCTLVWSTPMIDGFLQSGTSLYIGTAVHPFFKMSFIVSMSSWVSSWSMYRCREESTMSLAVFSDSCKVFRRISTVSFSNGPWASLSLLCKWMSSASSIYNDKYLGWVILADKHATTTTRALVANSQLVVPETPYIKPWCFPSKRSSSLAIGHAIINHISIKMRTGMAKKAPTARPCREQMACGRISEKMTMSTVEPTTAI